MTCILRRLAVVLVTIIMGLGVLASPIGAEKIELQMLSWLDTEFQQKYVDFANAYIQKRYPNVTVVGITTAGTGENYNSKVLVSTAAGAGPDIYFFNITNNFEPAWVDQYNMMLPIDARLDADPRFKADFAPALLDVWRYKGKLIGVPTTIGQFAVYYNRNHFAEAGLEAPATNWTLQGGYKEAVRKLAVVNSDGTLKRYGEQLQTGLKGRFMNYVMSNGGHVVDEAVTRATLQEPAFVETVELFRELLDSNLLVTGGTGAAYDKFVAESASMLVSGIFYQSRVQTHANFDWGVARMPAGRAGRATVANTNAWVINPQSRHIDLAWELAKGLSSAEFTEFALKEGLEFPVALSALRRFFFETLPPHLTRDEGLIWLEAMDYLRPFPKHALMPDIWKAAEAQLKRVWNRQAGPANALQIAAEQINGIIAQGAQGK